ncbi:tailspike protein [Streptomyces phage phiRKBJ001]|nr:tailspike protein [Streptomyces phage phiRKBJ001]
MAIPDGVETVTITSGAPLTLPDGTLIRGHIRFVAPDLNVIGDEDYIFGGESTAELCHGEFSITLVPPDATGITPTGWTYTAIAEFVNAPDWVRYVDITKDDPNVFLDDVIVLTPGDITNPDTVFVRKAGDTMTGALTLFGAPTQDLHAATKKYVDDHIPDTSDFVDKDGDTMLGELVLFGDPTVALGAAPKQYVDAEAAAAQAAAEATAAAESVSLSGDTMTGPLVLNDDPIDALGAATKQYVDQAEADAVTAATAAAAAESVSLSGDTMTGPLILSGAPATGLGAATKDYADQVGADAEAAAAAESVSLSGDTMTGPLVLNDDPSLALGAATKQYVDQAQADAEANAAAESVSLSGDTMTGPLVLNDDPTLTLGAATKQYVDAAQAAAEANADAESVSLSGDTMTGELVLFGDPTVANGAANKSYVDTLDAENVKLTGAQTIAGVKTFSSIPVLPGTDPTAANEAVRKAYVDTLDAQNVKLTGDQNISGTKTFSNTVEMNNAVNGVAASTLVGSDTFDSWQLSHRGVMGWGDGSAARDAFFERVDVGVMQVTSQVRVTGAAPSNAADLTRKDYVDTLDAENVKLSGAQSIDDVKTFTSSPIVPDPTTDQQAASKSYVDQGDDARVAVAGDTMTGALVLYGDPMAPLEAATQQYVDQQADAAQAAAEATAASESVSITGDTMTGPLTLPGDPVNDLEAAPKQYVDDTINEELFAQLGLSTGVLIGGELNVNPGDNTMVDIGDTYGVIVNYVDTPSAPTITKVTYAADTVTITNLSEPITWLLIDSTGTLSQQTTRPTNTQRRTHLVLGGVLVAGGGIIQDQSLPNYPPQMLNQLYDLMDALGPFNVSGNLLTPAGANLQLAKTAGTVFNRGFNHYAGSTLTRDPHISSTAAQNPVTMRYVTQVPAAPVATVTVVDPTKYDVAGTITTVPGGSGVSTIQRVYITPLNSVSAQVVIQYGQTAYANLDAAIAAIGNQSFVRNPNLADATLLGYVVAKKSCTNLSTTADARVIQAARISGNSAGSGDSLSLALLLTGGTMTGDLVLAADPDQPLEAATKQYVDAGDATAVKLTGAQTVAGVKTFSSIPVGPASDPATANQLTRKSYVDTLDGANVKLTGAQTVAGVKTFSSIPVGPGSDPTAANQLTRKSYVDAGDSANATSISTLDGEVVKLTGAQSIGGVKTFTSIPVGPASDPTTDNQLTRKLYVDNGLAVVQGNVDDVVADLATLDGEVVKLAGDQSVAGIKTFSSIPILPASNPTTDNQATRKLYVDTLDGANVKLTGNQSISGVKTFSSGINVTAGLGSDRYARKTANTSRSSTTSVSNDPHLFVSVEANATYSVICQLAWRPSGSGGFRFDFSGPSGAEMIFIDNDSGSSLAIGDDLTFNVTVGATIGGTLVTAGTSGTLNLRWAQRVSDAANTILNEHSSIWLRRVA